MKSYTVYCDGSIKNNGKASAVSTSVSLIEKENKFGGEERFLVSYKIGNTTSNRAEMIAALQALNYIKFHGRFVIYSDSEYLVKGFNERLATWSKDGWKTKNGLPVANKDLWLLLENMKEYHDCLFIHVKGHSGDEKNETVDQLAKKVMRNPEDFKDRITYLGKKLIFL